MSTDTADMSQQQSLSDDVIRAVAANLSFIGRLKAPKISRRMASLVAATSMRRPPSLLITLRKKGYRIIQRWRRPIVQYPIVLPPAIAAEMLSWNNPTLPFDIYTNTSNLPPAMNMRSDQLNVADGRLQDAFMYIFQQFNRFRRLTLLWQPQMHFLDNGDVVSQLYDDSLCTSLYKFLAAHTGLIPHAIEHLHIVDLPVDVRLLHQLSNAIRELSIDDREGNVNIRDEPRIQELADAVERCTSLRRLSIQASKTERSMTTLRFLETLRNMKDKLTYFHVGHSKRRRVEDQCIGCTFRRTTKGEELIFEWLTNCLFVIVSSPVLNMLASIKILHLKGCGFDRLHRSDVAVLLTVMQGIDLFGRLVIHFDYYSSIEDITSAMDAVLNTTVIERYLDVSIKANRTVILLFKCGIWKMACYDHLSARIASNNTLLPICNLAAEKRIVTLRKSNGEVHVIIK